MLSERKAKEVSILQSWTHMKFPNIFISDGMYTVEVCHFFPRKPGRGRPCARLPGLVPRPGNKFPTLALGSYPGGFIKALSGPGG